MLSTRHIKPAIQGYPALATKARYKIDVACCNNPWADSKRPYMQRLLGTDNLGAKFLELYTLGEKHVLYVQHRDQTTLRVLRGTRPTLASRDGRYYRMDRGTRHHQGNKSATWTYQ
jgi:hypothetical protein